MSLRRIAAVALLCIAPLNSAAQSKYLVSPVCAKADEEVTRVSNLPYSSDFLTKGDLPVATYSHYLSLLKSPDCACAAAESMLPRGDPRSLVPNPDMEPIWELARLNLQLPECQSQPDLVVAIGFCPSDEILESLQEGIQNALRGITDARFKPLLQDAVVRGACFRQEVGSGYRMGVWRHAYGNPELLRNGYDSGKPPDEILGLHLPASSLRRLLADAAPEVQAVLQENMLNLVTGDDKSLHLGFDGEATPGNGTARLTINIDVRILQFQTRIFEEGVTLTDTMRIETVNEHQQRATEAQAALRSDIPAPPETSLLCESSAEANREIDIVRVFAALFVVPTFGPGIAGGLDWWTSRTLNDELASAGIGGVVCGLIEELPARSPLENNSAVTIDFGRALSDDTGIHLYGVLLPVPKEPVVWITTPLAPLALNPPSHPGTWLIAHSLDLFEPTYSWFLVSGGRVDDAAATPDIDEAVHICGPRPGGNTVCVLPGTGGTTWVNVMGTEKKSGISSQGTYFRSGNLVNFCSSRGCSGSN